MIGSPAKSDPDAQSVLYKRGLKKLQATVFHERDVSSRQLDLKRSAVVCGPEQDGTLLSSPRYPTINFWSAISRKRSRFHI